MLALFKPWGFDYQKEEFENGGSFTTLWSQTRGRLCKRLRFHVENFDSLRKSKEEVAAERAKRNGEEETVRCNSSFDSDYEYFGGDSDDGNDEDVFTEDISVGIGKIASGFDERGLWPRMPDLQRIKELRYALKSTERYTVGRGNSFGMF